MCHDGIIDAGRGKPPFFLSTDGILTSVDWVSSKSVSITVRAITGFAGFELVLSIRRGFASIIAILYCLLSFVHHDDVKIIQSSV